MNFLNEFNNSYYLSYNKKQVRKKQTWDNFFLIKQIYKLIKIKKHVWLRT